MRNLERNVMSDPSAPILIASDLSARSDRALARGIDLARRLDTSAVVRTVLDSAMPEDMAEDLAARSAQRLKEQAEAIGQGEVAITIDAHIGDPGDDIVAKIVELKPRLLVMGTHRRRPFLDILRETTMQRVVRNTDCPALLVKDTADRGYDRIIAATDFSPAAAAAGMALGIAEEGCEVTPVHALYVPFTGRMSNSPELMRELEASFRNDAKKLDTDWRDQNGLAALPDTQILGSSPIAVIEGAVGGAAHALIAIGAHGRVGASRSMLGSVVTDLMRDPPCDILVARP